MVRGNARRQTYVHGDLPQSGRVDGLVATVSQLSTEIVVLLGRLPAAKSPSIPYWLLKPSCARAAEAALFVVGQEYRMRGIGSNLAGGGNAKRWRRAAGLVRGVKILEEYCCRWRYSGISNGR